MKRSGANAGIDYQLLEEDELSKDYFRERNLHLKDFLISKNKNASKEKNLNLNGIPG